MAQAQPVKAISRAFLPLIETGLYPNIVCLNAQPELIFDITDSGFAEQITCEQPYRPLYNMLKNMKLDVFPNLNLSDHKVDACLVTLSKFKVLNEQMFRRAWQDTREDGIILAGGAKTDGISALHKKIKLQIPDIDYIAKFHSVVFWIKKKDATAIKFFPAGENQIITSTGAYITADGIFSSDKIDAGSQMLVNHFNNRINGNVADFGAGWGYLSRELLRRSENIEDLNLFESDWQAIEACRKNLTEHSNSTKIKFFWKDIVGENLSIKFDWVVMNPPFHQGRETRLDLGISFVQCASNALRKAGQLLMVANRKLAYEPALNKHFSTHKVLEEANGFKIIWARK